MNENRLPQRKSPRLQGYDYSQSGAYFVTICTHQRLSLFGSIRDEIMYRSALGEIANMHWDDLLAHFPDIELDVFVVMPNHVHGIIVLSDEIETPGGIAVVPTISAKRTTLGTIIATYKAAVTRHAHQRLAKPPDKVWQSRYHDHIIRSEEALNTIRSYVVDNPARWQDDTFYIP